MIACLLMNLQARKLASITVSAGTGIRIAYISDLHFDRILIQPSYLIKQIWRSLSLQVIYARI